MSDTPDWLAGGPDEEVVWHGHPRYTTALPGVLVGVLVAAAGAGVLLVDAVPNVVSPLPVALGLFVAAFASLRVRSTRYVVTNRAWYRKTGILSRDVRRLSRSRVQNSTTEQDALGALFGYGTVTIDAAGGQALAFSNVENPGELRSLVDRSKSVPGSIEQWRAVREEASALRAALE